MTINNIFVAGISDPVPTSVQQQSKRNGNGRFSIRLHLIRHGETEANHAGIVLGQTESPLTEVGINQARYANQSIGKYCYWRRYASDLTRAEDTARIILGLDNSDNGDVIVSHNYDGGSISSSNSKELNSDDSCKETHFNSNPSTNSKLIIDKRLRERAKGVREGRKAEMTYDEAMTLFHLEQKEKEKKTGIKESPPLLEVEEEVLDRMKDWIDDVLHDAHMEFLARRMHNCDHNAHDGDDDGDLIMFHVFAVTHSGTLRIVIENMVGDQLVHHNVRREKTDADADADAGNHVGTVKPKLGRLLVPNTSVTTIDVIPHIPIDDDVGGGDDYDYEMKKLKWKANLIDLTSIAHLDKERL